MDTKSSDGENKKESSMETEMETSTGVDTSLLGKRKLEETHEQDENSGEEGVDGDEEEMEEEEEEEGSDFYWEKDSFDGREYHSSEDSSDYSDEDLQEKARYYNRTVIETKGFYESSDKLPMYLWSGIAVIPDRDLEKKMYGGITGREFIGNMASECVGKHNRRNNKNVRFEHLLRVNFDPGAKTKYYITFAARESDSPNAPLVDYQAKVVWSAGITYPIFCRPAPPLKQG